MTSSSMAVHFSSEKQTWQTPPALFFRLDREFGFRTDAAASVETALCPWYWDEAFEALSQDWAAAPQPIYCNPPYRDVARWIEKAAREARRGATVAMLLPARPDTRAWFAHIHGQPNVEVRWVRGRLRFVGAPHAAPFPSAVIVFRPPAATTRAGEPEGEAGG